MGNAAYAWVLTICMPQDTKYLIWIYNLFTINHDQRSQERFCYNHIPMSWDVHKLQEFVCALVLQQQSITTLGQCQSGNMVSSIRKVDILLQQYRRLGLNLWTHFYIANMTPSSFEWLDCSRCISETYLGLENISTMHTASGLRMFSHVQISS